MNQKKCFVSSIETPASYDVECSKSKNENMYRKNFTTTMYKPFSTSRPFCYKEFNIQELFRYKNLNLLNSKQLKNNIININRSYKQNKNLLHPKHKYFYLQFKDEEKKYNMVMDKVMKRNFNDDLDNSINKKKSFNKFKYNTSLEPNKRLYKRNISYNKNKTLGIDLLHNNNLGFKSHSNASTKRVFLSTEYGKMRPPRFRGGLILCII